MTGAQLLPEASLIAQKRIGQMWADPANVGTYVEANTSIAGLLPNGTRTVSLVAGTNQYQVTVNWQLPGTPTQRNYTTTVIIAGG